MNKLSKTRLLLRLVLLAFVGFPILLIYTPAFLLADAVFNGDGESNTAMLWGAFMELCDETFKELQHEFNNG